MVIYHYIVIEGDSQDQCEDLVRKYGKPLDVCTNGQMNKLIIKLINCLLEISTSLTIIKMDK